MTPTAKECIDCLRQARKAIESGREEFLCNAIEYETDASWKVRDHLCQWIKSILCGSYTLNNWLWKNFRVEYRPCNQPKFRSLRLAWIDWMIAELEKEPT